MFKNTTLTCLTIAAVTAAVPAAGPRAHAGQYTFHKIADNSGQFKFFWPPAINNSGRVVFWTEFDNGVQGIFTGHGQVPQPVVTTQDLFQGQQIAGIDQYFPSINDDDVVAFHAIAGGVQHIFTRFPDNSLVNYVNSSPGPGGFQSLRDPWIGSSGSVAYGAVMNANGKDAIFNGGLPVIVETDSEGRFFAPDLNDTDNVAFTLPFTSMPGGAVYRNVVRLYDQDTLIKPAGSSVTINNSNTVAFVGTSPFGYGVFTGDGVTTNLIVDVGAPFFLTGVDAPAINNAGRVVFKAGTAAFSGIFYGPNPQTHTVITTGQPLFGSRVTGIDFYRGLNDAGQVAFSYYLANNEYGVAVATPRDKTALGNGDFNNGSTFWQWTGLEDGWIANLQGNPVLQLSTETLPTGVRQLVDTSEMPYVLQFDFDWLSVAGTLAVTVNDQEVLSLGPLGVSSHVGILTVDPAEPVNEFTRLTLEFTPAAFADPNAAYIAFDLFPGSEATIQLDNITFQPVPEPASLALLLVAALAALCRCGWRRRNSEMGSQ